MTPTTIIREWETILNRLRDLKSILKYRAKWIVISSLIGIACGIASAVFLAALEQATQIRETHTWLLLLLPISGLVIGALYHAYGKKVESGNNLIIDEFHNPAATIPFRMAPLVFAGTIFTHLMGGSAGREGTAIQMGGSIADQFTHIFKTSKAERQMLLMAGMSGGFGSIFGVPFAGTIFGLEVLAIGRLHLWGIIECAISAFVAHHVTIALGIHHVDYHLPTLGLRIFSSNGVYAVFAGALFGLAARLFAFVTDHVKDLSKAKFPILPVRSLVGGALISMIYFLLPWTTRYSGLGVPIISDSLKTVLPAYDWLGKLVLTALTLGLGFKGGEVTPLLFVGATFGNALSHILPIPFPLLAAMGFVGVFSGAANTPFACSIMAIELFGAEAGGFAAIACFASYLVSGHHGIYHSQQVHTSKTEYAIRTLKLFKGILRRPVRINT